MRASVLAIAAAACGGSKAPPKPAGPPAALQATPAPGDVAVAQVNGRAVWASCVVAQAAREHVTRDVALRECIDFELMAQQAEQRGLARDPEAIEATQAALVNRVVTLEYELGYMQPQDFGGAWNDFVKKKHAVSHLRHGEYRASTYVRVPVAAKPPADDPAAHALADKIAAAAAGERGMLGTHLVELAAGVTGTKLDNCKKESTTPCFQDVPLFLRDALEPPYADALWAIPGIGRSTGPVRSSYGWDVIVWTDVQPAANPTDDEITAAILPLIKPWYFATWVSKLEHELGIHVAFNQDADKLLEASP
jgi:hypothetical protein